MAPDSLSIELVAIAASVIAAVVLGVFFNRSHGWRQILLRTVTVLACVLSSTTVAAVWVNQQVDFLPKWPWETKIPSNPTPGVDGPVAPTGSKAGQVLTVTVAGTASKLTMQMYVYLPPGYDPNSPVKYPVIEAFHGYPGGPAQWTHVLAAPEILAAEITAGRMAPTVVLFPYISPNPVRLDTECINLHNSAQTDTFLTKDVPAYASSHYQVRSDQSGWGLIGFSAGAYCATQLLLRHPTQYAAAASLSGLTKPGIRVGDGSENTEYDILWRLHNKPVPAVALYLACATQDASGALKGSIEIEKAAHNPMIVNHAYITGGGHSNASWKAMEAPAFDWLSTWLGQPTGPNVQTPNSQPPAANPSHSPGPTSSQPEKR